MSSARRTKKKNVETGISMTTDSGSCLTHYPATAPPPAPPPASLAAEAVLPPLNPPEVPKKGRKKQFAVVASVGPNGIQGNLLPEIRKPLIAHLPIQSRDIQFGCLTGSGTVYDPNPPPTIQPFDSEEFNSFSDMQAKWDDEQLPRQVSLDEISSLQNKQIESAEPQNKAQSQEYGNSKKTEVISATDKIDYYKKELTLLVQFEGSKDTKALPETSDAACFWCCHTFTNKPCILPQRDLGTHLLVSGNFCSPECAMAYLFDSRIDSHSRWEQMSLLHRIYSDSVGGRIYPAPSKKVLKMFGGILTIEQYRDNLKSHKYRVDIHTPPMVSILSTMDTKPIDFYDASLIKTILETAQERVAKAEEVLRLKRSKPLKAWESTLDACINLRVIKAVPNTT